MSKDFEPLSSFLSDILDYRGKTPKKLGSDWTDSGYRALSANNVTHGGLKELSSIRYVDNATYRKWMKDEVCRGDILLTSEAPAGQALLWESDEKIVLSQRLFGLRSKRPSDAQFLKYYLQSPLGQKIIRWRTSGSTVSGISAKMFDYIPVVAKHSPAQRGRIGEVLGLLDAKIKLNCRINEELEGIAKLLYDYWFVQFNFPITADQAAAMGDPTLEGKPYLSSGGKMVYNPILKREIPEDWVEGTILDVATLGGGGTPNTKNSEYWSGDIPFFTPSDSEPVPFKIDTEERITDKGLRNSSTKVYEAGTIFITARGSVGKVMIAAADMAMNQSCYALSPKPDSNTAFTYFHALSLVEYLCVKSSGSIFKSIVTNDFKFTPAIVPNNEVMAAFDRIASPLFAQILVNQKQNRCLSELRDWLLPMLMNGQVTVS